MTMWWSWLVKGLLSTGPTPSSFLCQKVFLFLAPPLILPPNASHQLVGDCLHLGRRHHHLQHSTVVFHNLHKDIRGRLILV